MQIKNTNKSKKIIIFFGSRNYYNNVIKKHEQDIILFFTKGEKRNMKRRVLSLFLAAAMVMGLCACAGEDKSGNAPGGAGGTDKEDSGKTVVTLWETLAESEQEVYQKYVDEFNAQSDTVEVQLVYMPPENFNTQVAVGNLSSEMGDILRVDNPNTVGFAASGVLADLTDYYNGWDGADFMVLR